MTAFTHTPIEDMATDAIERQIEWIKANPPTMDYMVEFIRETEKLKALETELAKRNRPDVVVISHGKVAVIYSPAYVDPRISTKGDCLVVNERKGTWYDRGSHFTFVDSHIAHHSFETHAAADAFLEGKTVIAKTLRVSKEA